jgi:hypothetical protein
MSWALEGAAGEWDGVVVGLGKVGGDEAGAGFYEGFYINYNDKPVKTK